MFFSICFGAAWGDLGGCPGLFDCAVFSCCLLGGRGGSPILRETLLIAHRARRHLTRSRQPQRYGKPARRSGSDRAFDLPFLIFKACRLFGVATPSPFRMRHQTPPLSGKPDETASRRVRDPVRAIAMGRKYIGALPDGTEFASEARPPPPRGRRLDFEKL